MGKELSIAEMILEIMNNPVLKTKRFQEVITIYKEHLDSGINFLLSKKDLVREYLNTRGYAIITMYYNKDDESGFILSFMARLVQEPDIVPGLYSLLNIYSSEINVLLDSLINNKNIVLNFIKIGTDDFKPELNKPIIQKVIRLPEISKKPEDVKPPVFHYAHINTKRIIDQLDTIKEWNNLHPFEDTLIIVPPIKGLDTKVVVAGSKALENFINELSEGFTHPEVRIPGFRLPLVKSNDTDIFHLDSKLDTCFKFKDLKVDNVYTTKKTVSDLLMGFDLPCCRVAQDNKGQFYVSAKALAAIFGDTMILPEYTKTKETLLNKYLMNTNKESAEFWVDKFTNRVEKYQSRGFTIKYMPTNEIMSFIERVKDMDDWIHNY